MRSCVVALPGVLVLLAIGACEKAPAPKPDDTPALKPVEPTATAAAPPAASTSAAVAETAPVPAPSATVEAAKPAASGSSGGKVATGAPKAASTHLTGKNFALDVTSPGCKSGQDCTMTIKLVPGGEFHVNKEYPYKFIAAPSPGVTYLGKTDPNQFTRAAGDFVEQGEKAGTMTVRFKPAAGEQHVAGKYKLSVCSAEQCQIEEASVDLPVSVL